MLVYDIQGQSMTGKLVEEKKKNRSTSNPEVGDKILCIFFFIAINNQAHGWIHLSVVVSGLNPVISRVHFFSNSQDRLVPPSVISVPSHGKPVV